MKKYLIRQAVVHVDVALKLGTPGEITVIRLSGNEF